MNTLNPMLKPLQLGAHIVPGIWRYMLPEDVLYFRVDPEAQSSCFNCPQVKAFGFNPSVRCCTYIPRVPNFLLGLGLLDTATTDIISRFIRMGYTIPEGSQLSPAQMEESLGFLHGKRPMGSVVCPLLDQPSKKCQIYGYRNGVCSTFFCRHDQAETGAAFWESLGDLVTQVETALSQWALAQCGFDLPTYFQRFNALGQNLDACSDPQTLTWSETARAELFGEWLGREEQLFRRCGELVIDHKDELFRIAGRQTLHQTIVYDAASRQRFVGPYPARLVAESLPEGEPMSIPSLWYTLQLAHRNLQLNRHKRLDD